MKALVIGDEKRMQKYLPDMDIAKSTDIVVADRGTADEEIVGMTGDDVKMLQEALNSIGYDQNKFGCD